MSIRVAMERRIRVVEIIDVEIVRIGKFTGKLRLNNMLYLK